MLGNTWKITKQTFVEFFDDNILKHSASLAFFTIFSLPGLLIMVIWVSDIFYGRQIVEGSVYGQIESFIGHDSALQLQETIHNAASISGNKFATIIGFITLIIGATSVFTEIQDSINSIWRLKARPKKGSGWLKLLINRLLSFSMIITLGFILLVSLALNGAMDILFDHLMQRFPNTTVVMVYVINLVLTYFITSFIFGMIFKVLPDARIDWKHVRIGAFLTAALFMVGKFLIGYYLGHNRVTSAYGTAGSVIVVLLWVYYSSIILYFGAVFTRVYVVCNGSRIYPNKYAVWIQQVEVESEKSIQQQPEEKKQIIETPPDQSQRT